MMSAWEAVTRTTTSSSACTTTGRDANAWGQIGVNMSASTSRVDDGPTRGQRVAGRAGRGRYDDAVAGVVKHELVVDFGLDANNTGERTAVDDDVVERHDLGDDALLRDRAAP